MEEQPPSILPNIVL